MVPLLPCGQLSWLHPGCPLGTTEPGTRPAEPPPPLHSRNKSLARDAQPSPTEVSDSPVAWHLRAQSSQTGIPLPSGCDQTQGTASLSSKKMSRPQARAPGVQPWHTAGDPSPPGAPRPCLTLPGLGGRPTHATEGHQEEQPVQRGSFILSSHLTAHPPPQLRSWTGRPRVRGTRSGIHPSILCPFRRQRLTYGVPALRRAVFWGLGHGYNNALALTKFTFQ